jgi:hypothetical protein
MKNVLLTLLTVVIILPALSAQEAQAKAKARKPHPSLVKVADEPGLPRVLLIGDSISMGYTLPVRALLKGQANVHRIPTNGGPTSRGVESIDSWLGDSKWDVIHFNWGLHDLKFIQDDPSKRADPKAAGSHHQVTIEKYEANLEALVSKLKATGAKLIWCNTTPVPEGTDGRVAGEELVYNETATRVMAKHGVPTNDLLSHAKAKLAEVQLPANVHFSDKGSEYLAEKVAAEIAARLPGK